LEKEPGRRYESAADLAADLRRFLAGERTRARPPGFLGRALKWSRRHPVILVLLTAVLVLLSGSAAALVFHLQRLEVLNTGLSVALDERDESNHHLRRTSYAAAVRRADALIDRGEVTAALEALREWEPQLGQEDLRGWEWYYVRNRVSQGEITRWIAGGHIYSLAFSPDGRALAGGGGDGMLHVWDPDTGRELGPPRAHPAELNVVAWLSEGREIVTGGDDGVIRIWAKEGGAPRELPGGPVGKISSITLSPDGRSLVTAGKDGAVRLWDVTGRSPSRIVARGPTPVRAAGFSPDGTALIAEWDGHRPQVLDPTTGQRTDLTDASGAALVLVSVRTTPGGRRVVLAGRHVVQVREWGAGPDRVQCMLPGYEVRVEDAALGADGRTLVLAAGSVKVWDLDGPRLRCQLHGHQGRVWAVAVHPNGRTVASAGADGTVRLWDIEAASAAQEPLVLSHARSSLPILLLPDGDRLAIARQPEAGLEIWEWGPGGPRRTASTPTPVLSWLTPTPDGQVVLAADLHYQLLAVDLSAGSGRFGHESRPGLRRARPPAPLSPPNKWNPPVVTPSRPLIASPDGRWLVTALGHDVHIREVGTGNVVATLSGHRGAVAAVAFEPHGGTMATGSKDGFIRLWDVAGGTSRGKLGGEAGAVLALAYTPDGNVLASGGEDQIIRLWHLRGGERRQCFGHRGPVQFMGCAADSRTLASGGADGELRLWQTSTGNELLTFTGPGNVSYTTFSTDGRYLISVWTANGETGQIVVRRYDCGRPLPLP
jgi:WD40 repeat protein